MSRRPVPAGATSRTETRHNAEDKTCHHFEYHGLTCDEYDALYARSGGLCEICGVAEESTKHGYLVIDHFWVDYLTAAGTMDFVWVIRGLLCHWCNNVVMVCHDGQKVWGPASSKYRDKAREYEAKSWQTPTALELELMAARTELLPKALRRAAA